MFVCRPRDSVDHLFEVILCDTKAGKEFAISHVVDNVFPGRVPNVSHALLVQAPFATAVMEAFGDRQHDH